MPPVTMTGVIATASSPTSTNSRVISNAFAHVRKFVPIALKTTISTASTAASTSSCVTWKRRSVGRFTRGRELRWHAFSA